MSNFEARVIAHSISEVTNKELVTLVLRYPRFIHSEMMTHRVFSRNASSSRAIPVKKMLAQVWNAPAMPIHWGKNQAGMQAQEQLSGFRLEGAKALWRLAGKFACAAAYTADKLGLHKQVTNRLLEPWQFISVVVTATEWSNFFELRDHPDAQPEIQALAKAMKAAIQASTPRLLRRGEWHLPFIQPAEQLDYPSAELLKMSAARCARVSYLTHEGREPSAKADFDLYQKLVGSAPIHASPVEHQACAEKVLPEQESNLKGWLQYRKLVEAQDGSRNL